MARKTLVSHIPIHSPSIKEGRLADSPGAPRTTPTRNARKSTMESAHGIEREIKRAARKVLGLLDGILCFPP